MLSLDFSDLVAASILQTIITTRGRPLTIRHVCIHSILDHRCVWQQHLLACLQSTHLLGSNDVLLINNTDSTFNRFNWCQRALVLRCSHPTFQEQLLLLRRRSNGSSFGLLGYDGVLESLVALSCVHLGLLAGRVCLELR